MTQQDILNAVNNLAIGNHVSWQDIMYDADRAIDKINARLGAKFPKMSEVLVSYDSTYSIMIKGKVVPLFDDRYIRTIVIPFIASEILARDEEFTTIYNKYLLDVEDGLYDMFANEFNKIPEPLKQDTTTGIFFPRKAKPAPTYIVGRSFVQEHCEDRRYHGKDLDFTLNVNYHINLANIAKHNSFVVDSINHKFNEAYDIITISQSSPYYKYVSFDGVTGYTFDSWYKDPLCTMAMPEHVNLISDLNVYAKWNAYDTLTYNLSGNTCTVALGNNNFKDLVVNLQIPEYIQGFRITHVGGSFLPSSNNVDIVTFPMSDLIVQANAFNNFKGSKISFPMYGDIRFNANSLKLYNANLDSISHQYQLVLTKAVMSIDCNSFGTITTGIIGVTKEVNILVMRNDRTDNVFPSLGETNVFYTRDDGRTIRYTVTFDPNYRGE